MIYLHFGKIGQGKSYSCTNQILEFLEKGIDCYADWTIDPTPYFLYKHNKLWFRFKNYVKKLFKKYKPPEYGKLYRYRYLDDIYGIANGQIFMDEAHKYLNARFWEKTPPEFIQKMSQSRKFRTDLHFITQYPDQIEKTVRKLCNEAIKHSKWWKLLLWKEYDGQYIDKIDQDPENKVKTIASGFKIFKKHIAECYDTYELLGTDFKPFDGRPTWDYLKLLLNPNLKGGDKIESNNLQIRKLGIHRQRRKSSQGSQRFYVDRTRGGWEILYTPPPN